MPSLKLDTKPNRRGEKSGEGLRGGERSGGEWEGTQEDSAVFLYLGGDLY